MTEKALDRFVARTRDLFAEEPDPERRWAQLRPVLAELLADPDVQRAAEGWPDCVARDGRAENLLFYEDPDYGFVVNGLCKGGNRPGGRNSIHDHGNTYTLYGVLAGHERIERYDRVDDRPAPDRVTIRRSVDQQVGPGEIDLVKPNEIHAEVTVGERTVAVIIRSKNPDAVVQGRYDAEAGAYWQSLGPRQTPVEMLPQR